MILLLAIGVTTISLMFGSDWQLELIKRLKNFHNTNVSPILETFHTILHSIFQMICEVC